MFQYQQQHRYFAQIATGFDEIAMAECEALGARACRPAFRGFHFEADPDVVSRIIYTARLITRVLAPLVTFDCHSDRYLYRTALQQDWRQLLQENETFAVQAVTSNTPALKHSRYAALKVKDAICDYFRRETGRRPSVNVTAPDLGLHLFVRNNRATLSVDASGGSLHKRGYRRQSIAAPLQETLAAAIIRLTEWSGTAPLWDPMCGSGTLLCEAAMLAARIPAASLRPTPPLVRLPGIDPARWQAVKAAADCEMRPLPAGLISGSDIASEAIAAARANSQALPGGKGIAWRQQDFREVPQVTPGTVIVANPPYGVRLGARDEAEALFKAFGDFLKQRCTGCTAFVYAGDRPLLKKIGLKPQWTRPLHNGALPGVLGAFDLY